MLARARVLVDKTGEVGSLIEAAAAIPEERVRAEAAELLDSYLNSYYR